MDEREIIQAFAAVMEAWNEYRAKWIEEYGTDEGFADWFTTQVGASA